MIKETIIRWLGLDARYEAKADNYSKHRARYYQDMSTCRLIDNRFDVFIARFKGDEQAQLIHSLAQKRLADIVDSEQFLDDVVARLKAKQL